jgi:hypothetical protein
MTRRVGVLSSAGDELVVYYPDNAGSTIQNILASSATATWHDPRDGGTEAGGTFSPGESRSMTPPSGWEDALLLLAGGADTVRPNAPTNLEAH